MFFCHLTHIIHGINKVCHPDIYVKTREKICHDAKKV
jgi:hypothetical protein